MQHGGALFEGPLLRHSEVPGGEFAVLRAEHLAQLPRGPHVVRALDVPARAVVTVGVERGGEPAFVRAEFAHHEVGGLQGDATGELGAGGTPEMRIHPAQKCIVVQHLLEIGHNPLAIHGVPREPPTQLVVHPTRAIRSQVSCAIWRAPSEPVRAWCRSRNSITMDGGNLGAPPKPPREASYSW